MTAAIVRHTTGPGLRPAVPPGHQLGDVFSDITTGLLEAREAMQSIRRMEVTLGRIEPWVMPLTVGLYSFAAALLVHAIVYATRKP